MKTLNIFLNLFIVIFLSITDASAICIGCGCNGAYRDCIKSGTEECPHSYIAPDGTSHQMGADQIQTCCSVGLRNCHEGFGIGTRWFGPYGGTTIPTEPGYIPIDYNDIQGGLYVAFSVNGNIFGSHDGGQVIKPYHLLNQAELNQIAHLQPIINKYLNGIALSQEEINQLD